MTLEVWLSGDGVRLLLMALPLSTARLATLMLVLPLFTRLGLEAGLVRGGIVFALAIPVYPAVLAEVLAAGGLGIVTYLGLVAKEAFVGALLGLVYGVPFWAASAVGDFVDFQRGAEASVLVDPGSGGESTVLGTLLALIFAATFFATGLFTDSFLAGVYGSYGLWPVMQSLPALPLERTDLILAILDDIFRIAVVFAAPLLIAMLLVEGALALASRFVPRLEVFFVAMAAKSGVVVVMLPLYAAWMYGFMEEELGGLATAVSRVQAFLP